MAFTAGLKTSRATSISIAHLMIFQPPTTLGFSFTIYVFWAWRADAEKKKNTKIALKVIRKMLFFRDFFRGCESDGESPHSVYHRLMSGASNILLAVPCLLFLSYKLSTSFIPPKRPSISCLWFGNPSILVFWLPGVCSRAVSYFELGFVFVDDVSLSSGPCGNQQLLFFKVISLRIRLVNHH